MNPLVELHLHLDGSLRLATMLEIANYEGVKLPAGTEEGLYKALRCGTVRESLEDYLGAFAVTVSVMQSEYALRRVARELIEDVAEDGIKWAEIRFAPDLHTQSGLTQEQVVACVLKGVEEGCHITGINAGVILCSMRHYDPEITSSIIDTAIEFKDDILAVDMAGDDLNFDALEHAKHFRRAIENGLRSVIHAAEAGPAERAREAVDKFGAIRIGHGIRIGEDPSIVEMLLMRGIALEVCITSNIQIGMVGSAEKHPAKDYLNHGLAVTLNTDNRMLADTTLRKEFELARYAWGLTDEEESELILNAIEASFAPSELKERLRAELAG